MLVIGLLLRYGQSAEILAWATTFADPGAVGRVQPGRARSPAPIQPIAKLLPDHLRLQRRPRAARRRGGPVGRPRLGDLGALVLAALSMLYVLRMLRPSDRGYVTRYSCVTSLPQPFAAASDRA